jgi:hypothetical protein
MFDRDLVAIVNSIQQILTKKRSRPLAGATGIRISLQGLSISVK